MHRHEEDRLALERFLRIMRKKAVVADEAERLFNMFGSLDGILESGEHMLEKAGADSKEAHALALIPELSRYMRKTSQGEHPVFRTLTTTVDYLKALYMGVHVEQFHALCLNAGGRLLDSAMLQEGTVDESPFYLDALLRYVITNNADAVILSHNHPAGSIYPSEADIISTTTAASALNVMGVYLMDHVIVAAGRCISLRQNGYLTSKAPKYGRAKGLYQGWLD